MKSVEIAADDQAELERIVRSSTAGVRMVERAQIVLCAAEGRSAAEIGRLVGCSTNTAQKWRARYEQDGIAGLGDLPRSGRPLIYSQADRARLIAKACTRPPETPEGAQQERWTYEQLGQAVGMSRAQAHTILARADIKPHLTDYWVMSDFSDPEFEERLKGVCGLYVNPPENVLVVSIDEKTGIQAKTPTKPDMLPAPGRPTRREHEYIRNSTQCLFACLKVHEGGVLAMTSKTRNRFDLIRFLDQLDSEIPVVFVACARSSVRASSGAEVYAAPGAVFAPPVNLQIQEAMNANPPWDAATVFEGGGGEIGYGRMAHAAMSSSQWICSIDGAVVAVGVGVTAPTAGFSDFVAAGGAAAAGLVATEGSCDYAEEHAGTLTSGLPSNPSSDCFYTVTISKRTHVRDRRIEECYACEGAAAAMDDRESA
ncbi:MAG TPA: IS630 family transposase [Solirubrobacteraceae bacterium]|nr:IS630 family transposase [Solirubrobacteraceae bacterium]